VAVAALVTEPLGRGWKPWLWLGDWSYSVYLMHPFAWLALETVASGAMSPVARLLLALALTLLISACTHHLIERPGQALGERLARARLPRRAGSVARQVVEHRAAGPG
jgi:peptidoglycan/LPS O-acetylase OafA/YrhL